MPKLAIVATIEVTPGRMNEYLPLMMAHRARCLEQEPGTLQFEVLRPRDDDHKLMLFELYSDEAAFESHLNGSSMATLRQASAGMRQDMSGARCVVLE